MKHWSKNTANPQFLRMKSSVFIYLFCKVELAAKYRNVPYQPDDKVKTTENRT